MNLLDQIVSSVVRPNRDIYSLMDLGPRKFLVKSVNRSILKVDRTDEVLVSRYGEEIHLSHYKVTPKPLLEDQEEQPNNRPTIIYVHTNNGSRMEGQLYLKQILKYELNVVLFDCTGSGISGGDYITLGARESQDLDTVVEHLLNRKRIDNVSLWGRSMGAVTAMLYASKTRRPIKACIFDSPFASLKRLVKEIGINKTGLPQFLLAPLISLIENKVEERVNYRLFSIDLIEQVRKIKVPGLFITSKNDTLVDSSHVQQLYASYSGKKRLEYISQQHQEVREMGLISFCTRFILENAQPTNFKMYQSQCTFQESIRDKRYQELKRTQPGDSPLQPSIEPEPLRKSLLTYSPSQEYLLPRQQEKEESSFKKKWERKSFSEKISISAFKKDSLKFRDRNLEEIELKHESNQIPLSKKEEFKEGPYQISFDNRDKYLTGVFKGAFKYQPRK